MHHTNAEQTSLLIMGGLDARTAASPRELRALRLRLRIARTPSLRQDVDAPEPHQAQWLKT